MNIEERFISYTKIDTTSNESDVFPSNENEFVLAKQLVEELKQLGVQDARMDSKGFVYGTIESNVDYPTKTFGLLAHMDTSNATSGKDIKARIIRNYDGNDIELSPGNYTTVADYDFLKDLKGKDLIVTDGTTLLGGDDKAGIAIIMDFVEKVNTIRHGKIIVCFTIDEETGEGITQIDRNQFNPDFAYTLDGGCVSDVTYENFNAASAIVNFYGNSIHPGSAKGKMINACQLAIDFHNMLPVNARPEFTDGRDGFNHLVEFEGTCQQAKAAYIIRNHDKALLEKQMHQFELITMHINEMYGRQVVELQLERAYSNMKECFEGKEYIIDYASQAIKELGYNVTYTPIRGGTDGANLSFMGIPTPNLGTGGYNCHGNHELVCIDEMKQMVQIVLKIAEKVAEK